VQHDSRPGTALALGLTGLALLFVTAGLGFVFSLPFSIVAWVIGARSARLAPGVIGSTGRNTARTGMWLGVAGTVIGVATLTIVAILMLIGIGVGIGVT
jgi:hypothetical protein